MESGQYHTEPIDPQSLNIANELRDLGLSPQLCDSVATMNPTEARQLADSLLRDIAEVHQ